MYFSIAISPTKYQLYPRSNRLQINVSSEFRPYLNVKERLLWTGQPKRGFIFKNYDLFLVVFGVFWLAFSCFWTFQVSKLAGAPGLFGTPFILVGLYLVFGRFIFDISRRKNTLYGLTEKRIIIKSGKRSTRLTFLDIDSITYVNYTEKKDQSGTISMRSPQTINTTGKKINNVIQLEGIPKVRKVYQQIASLKDTI